MFDRGAIHECASNVDHAVTLALYAEL